MHPDIIEAIITERVRDNHARANAARHARRARRSAAVPSIVSAFTARRPRVRTYLRAHAANEAA